MAAKMASTVAVRQRVANLYVPNQRTFTPERIRELWLAELRAEFGDGIAQKGSQLKFVSLVAAREYRNVESMKPLTLVNRLFTEVVEMTKEAA
jgi:hypothetical protein